MEWYGILLVKTKFWSTYSSSTHKNTCEFTHGSTHKVLKQYSDRTQTMLNTAQYLTNNSVTTHEFTQNSTHEFIQHSTHLV